jgi:hypothetical protein
LARLSQTLDGEDGRARWLAREKGAALMVVGAQFAGI